MTLFNLRRQGNFPVLRTGTFLLLLLWLPLLLSAQSESFNAISIDDVAMENSPQEPSTWFIETEPIEIMITADDLAIEPARAPMPIYPKQEVKTPPSQVVEYARSFWDGAEKEYKKRNINISGTKTFEMKKSDVSGDMGHFSTENYDSIPGFHLDQSLHLRIQGNITENSTVDAVLDDKDDEERRFTVNIDGPKWQFIMGDFPLAIDGTEFTLFRKEVRGILARWQVRDDFETTFLFSQSKGMARREQFRGAGQQQEFRMAGSPMVQNSERVSIDGITLQRGTDYFVDYEDGLIKFLPHQLPIEVTRWVVVEYEVADQNMAFSRNLYGSRQVYSRSEDKNIGFTWLREIDSTTPKSGDNASGTVAPMQHDILGADVNWRLSDSVAVKGETSFSFLDPNRLANEAPEDKRIDGNATRMTLTGRTYRTDADLTFRQIDKNFKVVGREGGVTELGERGLVNDIMSGKANLSYKIADNLKYFVDGEQSKTNLGSDETLPSIDFTDTNTGFIYETTPDNRFEIRGGRQHDRETGPSISSDVRRNTSAAIWDRKIGSINSQARVQKTSYDDSVNVSSGSEVLEMALELGSQVSPNMAWNLSAANIRVDDETVIDNLRSDTKNYTLDLGYDPNSMFNARGLFQWRREDDYLANSRFDTEIADAQVRYEPTRDLRTQLKYKIENTSKVIRDPSLDPQKYILPPSLPNSDHDELEIIGRFENPVQKTTANFMTDYQLNKYLQLYFDWRRRDLDDQATNIRVSTNDRKTYELRYTPSRRMQVTTEYEDGISRNHEPKTELKDSFMGLKVRHEFFEGYFLDAAVEERDETDKYMAENDKLTKSKILGLQSTINNWSSLELALQHNKIDAIDPSTEWEQRLAVVLTPFSRAQRYRFFVNNKDISSSKSSRHTEGGLSFSQFIGTDTMIDGVIKHVEATPGLIGGGYSATVFNAKMVITF